MLLLGLVLVPLCAGAAAFLIRPDAPRRALLVLVAAAHVGMTAGAWWTRPAPLLNGWIALDAQGLPFLSITSVLFLAVAVYALDTLRREGHCMRRDLEEDFMFANAPEVVFTGCLLLFLSTMTLVTVSHHLGLLWVAIESSTLASAPLIYFHRHHRSLEATWKYLMICSVGVALALLGVFFLALAGERSGLEGSMLLSDLVAHAGELQPVWLKTAFIFLLIGYGTKMGLAPLHTWLPDAHSEAPSLVSALLSGSLLNCAFLGILRIVQVMVGAGQLAFAQQQLVPFGLFSIALAGVFILGQSDYKRLLAYSSVEHMGILALGIGLGGAATYGALLHAINHSLAKAMLFLVAGNILTVYRTKAAPEVSGVARVLPVSGLLWLAGFFAITGTPPFGPFLSEFTILRGALDQGRFGIAAVYLVLLVLVFVGMATVILRMAQGSPRGTTPRPKQNEAWLSILPPVGLAAAVLVLGVYIPAPLNRVLHLAASALGGQ
jgi:hydrogenase-4 component F